MRTIVFRRLELTTKLAVLRNQVEVGDTLDQARSVKSRGKGHYGMLLSQANTSGTRELYHCDGIASRFPLLSEVDTRNQTSFTAPNWDLIQTTGHTWIKLSRSIYTLTLSPLV